MAKHEIKGIAALFVVFALLGFGCNTTTQGKNDFCASSGGWDYRRVPLVQPYEAINVNPGFNQQWSVDLPSDSRLSQGSLGNVVQVSVHAGYFYACSADSSIFNGTWVAEAYYVIATGRGNDFGFADHSEFATFLDCNGLDAPKWMKLDSLAATMGQGNGPNYCSQIDRGIGQLHLHPCR